MEDGQRWMAAFQLFSSLTRAEMAYKVVVLVVVVVLVALLVMICLTKMGMVMIVSIMLLVIALMSAFQLILNYIVGSELVTNKQVPP